jgi:hypothetical protein
MGNSVPQKQALGKLSGQTPVFEARNEGKQRTEEPLVASLRVWIDPEGAWV